MIDDIKAKIKDSEARIDRTQERLLRTLQIRHYAMAASRASAFDRKVLKRVLELSAMNLQVDVEAYEEAEGALASACDDAVEMGLYEAIVGDDTSGNN